MFLGGVLCWERRGLAPAHDVTSILGSVYPPNAERDNLCISKFVLYDWVFEGFDEVLVVGQCAVGRFVWF